MAPISNDLPILNVERQIAIEYLIAAFLTITLFLLVSIACACCRKKTEDEFYDDRPPLDENGIPLDRCSRCARSINMCSDCLRRYDARRRDGGGNRPRRINYDDDDKEMFDNDRHHRPAQPQRNRERNYKRRRVDDRGRERIPSHNRDRRRGQDRRRRRSPDRVPTPIITASSISTTAQPIRPNDNVRVTPAALRSSISPYIKLKPHPPATPQEVGRNVAAYIKLPAKSVIGTEQKAVGTALDRNKLAMKASPPAATGYRTGNTIMKPALKPSSPLGTNAIISGAYREGGASMMKNPQPIQTFPQTAYRAVPIVNPIPQPIQTFPQTAYRAVPVVNPVGLSKPEYILQGRESRP